MTRKLPRFADVILNRVRSGFFNLQNIPRGTTCTTTSTTSTFYPPDNMGIRVPRPPIRRSIFGRAAEASESMSIGNFPRVGRDVNSTGRRTVDNYELGVVPQVTITDSEGNTIKIENVELRIEMVREYINHHSMSGRSETILLNEQAIAVFRMKDRDKANELIRLIRED